MKSQEVIVKDDKTLSITMEEETNAMEEVVVNGLYSATKNTYTGASTTVTQEDLLAVSQTNVFKALTTLVPGMRIIENNEQGSNPNHIPEILIRGTTSIASEGEAGLNAPLIIVDGVETSMQALYDMDIFDIDRVDVLKDASATSIYGEKAANGVIVVQRKKVEDGKLRVRYNFVPDIAFPDVSSFDLCNPMQKLTLEERWGMYEQDGMDEVYNEKYKRIKSGVNTDWKSIPLRNSWSHTHSVSVTGRGSGVDYGITARYSDVRGVMKKDYRRNYGIGFYFNYFHNEKLSVSLRSDIHKTDTKDSPYGSFGEWVILNPYDSPYDESGELVPLLSFNAPNPMYNATTGSFNKNKSKSIINSLNLRWDIVKGLFLTASGSLSLSDTRADQYISNKHTDALETEIVHEKGRYSISGSEGTSWSGNAVLNYNISLDDKGTIVSLRAGSTISQEKSESYGFAGVGFLKPTLNDINFSSSYPSNSKPNGQESYSASVSAFGNINFVWRNRYFVDASYRISGNSVLGKEQRWAPYWSAGIGWNAHNESFIKALNFISTFRFRGSVGYVGSGNFAGNMSSTVYTYRGNYISGIAAVPNQIGNPLLKSQRTLSLNGGVSIDLLEGRFEVNFDLYKQLSKDLILKIDLPYSTGSDKAAANLGESSNWGYELAISALLIKTRDWIWRMTFNTHHSENKLLKISNSLKRRNEANMKAEGLSPKYQFEEGKSSTALFSVRSLGINPADGYEIFIKKDGTLTREYDPNDKVALGDTQPKFEGTIFTSLAWKNLSVNLSLSYTLGGYVYNETRAAKVENIDIQKNVDVRAFTDRWVKPGDVVAYPKGSMDYQSVHTSRFVEKKNELYLSGINISYTMNQPWLKRIGLKRLAVGIGFSDVLRLSTVKFERGTSYPYMRSLNLRISPTF